MKHSITWCVLCCCLPSWFVHKYLHREVVTWGAGRFGQLGNNAQQDSIDLQHITQSIPADSGKVIQVRLRCIYVFKSTSILKVITLLSGFADCLRRSFGQLLAGICRLWTHQLVNCKRESFYLWGQSLLSVR